MDKHGQYGYCNDAAYKRTIMQIGDRYKVTYTYPQGSKQMPLQRRPDAKRRRENIRRAARTIETLAADNPWTWWATLTIDPTKRDRINLDTIKQQLGQWLRDQRKRLGGTLAYLIVPEVHPTSGAWHIHGLLHGLIVDDLRSDWVETWAKLPRYISDRLPKQGEAPRLYWWPEWVQSWGYCVLEPVRDKRAIATYMAKYMMDNLGDDRVGSGKALYMASQGLSRGRQVPLSDIPDSYVVDSGYTWYSGAVYWLDDITRSTGGGRITDYSDITPQTTRYHTSEEGDR